MSEANAEQVTYWNDQAGPKWVALQSHLDNMLAPIGAAALDRLGDITGATVLDVGCGCGATTLTIARRVGAGGRVMGIDISRPMLERARQSAREAGLDNAEFVCADAQTETLAQTFDAVFSRFGVMFFADPTAAFANLRRAMRPDAALSFVCWRAIDQNQWVMVPMAAAFQHIAPPQPPPPGAPGPFAFADPKRVESILGGAGFENVEIEPHDPVVDIGGGLPLEQVAEFVVQMGPTARLLQDASPDLKRRVAEAIATALKPLYADGRVALKGAAWLVRARNAA